MLCTVWVRTARTLFLLFSLTPRPGFNLLLPGFCYEHGTGVATNAAEAARLYQLAADQGHTAAQFRLGETKVHQRIIESQLSSDCFCLAMCYKMGTGVRRDESEAIMWLELAADQKHAAAQFNLGKF